MKHGSTEQFLEERVRTRRFVLRESARIASAHVLIFDYGRDGGWFVRFIERCAVSSYLPLADC